MKLEDFLEEIREPMKGYPYRVNNCPEGKKLAIIQGSKKRTFSYDYIRYIGPDSIADEADIMKMMFNTMEER